MSSRGVLVRGEHVVRLHRRWIFHHQGGRNGTSEECQLEEKRRGNASQRKGIHTSNKESAAVTLLEDSQGTTKEGHEGIEERAPGDGNNKIDENRPREANGNDEPPSRTTIGYEGWGIE